MPTHLMIAVVLAFTILRPDETVRAYGAGDREWHLVELRGEPFTANATLTFPGKGRIVGQAPCNRYTGSNVVPYPWFGGGAIAATRRACPDLADETAFFTALNAATISVVERDTLILSDDDGVLLLFKTTD